MESTIVIIGFVIWPDLPRMQSLNHVIETLPTVTHIMCLPRHKRHCSYKTQYYYDMTEVHVSFGKVVVQTIITVPYTGSIHAYMTQLS